MPGFDWAIDGYTIAPAPFWGGVAFPTIVFGLLYLWPALERRFTRDLAFHNLLDRPRDAPVRTGIGVALITLVLLVFLAGSADRADVSFGLSYTEQVSVYRILVLVLPGIAGMFAHLVCRQLQVGDEVARIRRRAEAEARLSRLRRNTAPPASR